MDEYLKTNQETWDTWTRYHLSGVGSLLRAGLRITAFEEYPFVAWAVFP